jgi:hypothetical protein
VNLEPSVVPCTQARILSDSGHQIDTSKDLNAGSFLFGLIGDIRIYYIAQTADEIATLTQKTTPERNTSPNIVKELVI